MDTKTRKLLDTLAGLIEEAHDTHIFDDDDDHPNDCAYCAAVAQARAAIAEKPKTGQANGCREILADLVEWASHTGGWEAAVWKRAKSYLRAHPIVAPSAPGLYLIEVFGDVEPVIRGPYKSQATRDATAKRLKTSDSLAFFMLDMTPRGPKAEAYEFGFFGEE